MDKSDLSVELKTKCLELLMFLDFSPFYYLDPFNDLEMDAVDHLKSLNLIKTSFAGKSLMMELVDNGVCNAQCVNCYNERYKKIDENFHSLIRVMILCKKCGNKRCPHANNHLNECTKSNELGQKGSAYE